MNENERRGLVDDYLRRLEKELAGVPAANRRELIDDVRGHIEEAWAAAPEKNQATLLNILERVGTPETLAREERERLGIRPEPEERSPDLVSAAAVAFMVLFWPVGVLLAWISPRWTINDKLVATAFPLLGLVLLFASTMAAMVVYQDGPQQTAVGEVVTVVGEDGTALPEQTVPPGLAQDSGTAAIVKALFGRLLVFYGLLGAPWTAALFLALRLRPGTHRAARLVPAISGGLVLLAVAVVLAIPPSPLVGMGSG